MGFITVQITNNKRNALGLEHFNILPETDSLDKENCTGGVNAAGA
jgi:hypothetical protein